MNYVNIFFVCLIIYNIAVMIVYGVDKAHSRKRRRRIRESTLLLLAFCFGGVGSFLAMIVFNHKTAKMKFWVWVPFFCLLQAFILLKICKLYL